MSPPTKEMVEAAEEEDVVPVEDLEGQRHAGEVIFEPVAGLLDDVSKRALHFGQLKEEENEHLETEEGAEANVGALAGEELPEFAVELEEEEASAGIGRREGCALGGG